MTPSRARGRPRSEGHRDAVLKARYGTDSPQQFLWLLKGEVPSALLRGHTLRTCATSR